MSYYTYTVNLPYQNPTENARAFVRLPRSILLPPYLAINPYFVDYTDAIDQLFDLPVDAKLAGLQNIRNMWVTTRLGEVKISNGSMLSYTDWGGPDRSTVVQQVNLLGMKLANAGMIDEGSYRTIAKFLGTYWFEKGKGSTMDFLNFCTTMQFKLKNLWTEDYSLFLNEGDVGIGTSVFNGGTWYPTTHVRLQLVANPDRIDLQTVGAFFYEIANYNLVLESVLVVYDLPIVNTLYEGIVHDTVGDWGNTVGESLVDKDSFRGEVYPDAHIVAMAIVQRQHISIHSSMPDARPTTHSTVGGWNSSTGRPLTVLPLI